RASTTVQDSAVVIRHIVKERRRMSNREENTGIPGFMNSTVECATSCLSGGVSTETEYKNIEDKFAMAIFDANTPILNHVQLDHFDDDVYTIVMPSLKSILSGTTVVESEGIKTRLTGMP